MTRHLPDGEEMTIYDAAMRYAEEGTPLVVLAGKEYGSGSSRDWAAKGTRLLGVRAVIAETFERIHRSNLVGMGVLPLQFADGESAESLGLTGEEVFSITGHRRAATREARSRCAPATTSSRRACASTRPRRWSTSATAASCSTCCASCARLSRASHTGRPMASKWWTLTAVALGDASCSSWTSRS